MPTKYGWVFVNPYMTLVAAYERQIRGRGQEIKHEETVKQPTADESTASVAAPQQSPSVPAMPASALGQQVPPPWRRRASPQSRPKSV